MVRSALLCAVAAAAVSGCSTVSAPPRYVAVNHNAPPPNVSPQFGYAPRAHADAALFVCYRSASNAGPIGARGEAQAYSPFIYTRAGALLRNPTERACLSSGFGPRNLANGGGRWHTGLDLANREGGFIYAAGDARVERVGWVGSYGLVVQLDHGAGVRTLYAHLSEIDPGLRPGMRVAGGQAIARMGMTGNATGVHLHYEVEIDGSKVDPLNYGAYPNVS